MTDHFAIFDQPRRPWLDPEVLKEHFHRASATLHPDVPGTGDAGEFAALNAAYTLLRDPARRARYLLELEAPSLAEGATVPLEMGDLFTRQAAMRQRLHGFFAKRAAAGNSLARAFLALEATALRREVEAAQGAIESARENAFADLRTLDQSWLAADVSRYTELAGIQRRLAFLGKWCAQLDEALFQLRESEVSVQP